MLIRRKFITGMASLFAVPAIVRAENIMPVRTIIAPEPLLRGIAWQSWPIDAPRPNIDFAQGSITSWVGHEKPLSHWVKLAERHRKVWPDLCLRPVDQWPDFHATSSPR